MDPRRFRRAWEIAAAALDLAPAQRAAHVADACADDAALRAEVESLLAHSGDATAPATALAVDAADAVEDAVADDGPLPGRIAGYAIVRKVGAGGMGVVYEAIQDAPHRRVALKLTRPGHMTAELQRRFEFEVEVLAGLQHPGITQVFDAGTCDLGHGPQPFFAMEFVDGEPLDAHAARRALDIPQRVELLARVSDAVHHAHRMGVLHRDLKPDNVLVTADGQPKVLDFGVARALGAGAPGLTRRTAAGRVVGTLAYMSPEQVQGDGTAMTAASDVWALGVIGYELLAGRAPFALPGDNLAAAARVLAEQEPAPLGRHDRRLRGDLEVVIGTALQKEPLRRYASAAEFAADLRRVLACRAIVARAPSTLYQLSRFARRNRALTAALAALLLTVVAAFGWTLRQNRALDRTGQELRRLADDHLLQALDDEFPHLAAARPEDAAALAAWRDRARAVVARRPLHELSLQALRARALPYADADRDRDRRRHGRWNEYQTVRHDLAAADDPTARAELQLRVAAIEADFAADRSWRFADPTDQWAHDTVEKVLERCAHFADPETGPYAKVGEWLEVVPHLRERMLGEDAALWDAAIADIADPERCPAYGGLQLAPQLGLVPLGRDPRSGLWEFGHPQTGAVPTRDADGDLVLADDFGLVFVLVPAGRFAMGAVRPDADHPPGAPNVDPLAAANEAPVHPVELDAFFLSKYEMTKAQWQRFTGRRDGQLRGSPRAEDEQFTTRDPIETVHWVRFDEAMRALGLTIPTEAQWEYAARAGTTAPYLGGDDPAALRGVGNLFDRRFMRALPLAESDEPLAWSFDDGATEVTAVGRYAPNAFGLHDVLGNVKELCLDHPVGYDQPTEPGTGLRRGGDPEFHGARGGSYNTPPRELRVSMRWRVTRWTNVVSCGLRPARALRPGR
ncbi:MAG: bifunctional serine/threonine-protein kinase/formylglycine-generating enzyme family protein [Planctomycetota bacterium]